MLLLIRCCSSLTPGRLKPSLKPRGRLKGTGATGPVPGLIGPVFLLLLFIGFLNTLIMTSAFS
jgi:hypothetical protein